MSNTLSLFIFFYFLISSPPPVRTDDDCKVARCSNRGPQIRFPFHLRTIQPDRCGYRGFDLSCENRQTLIHLPNSVTMVVSRIDYLSQTIHLQDRLDCVPTQLPNLNLTRTQFNYATSSSNLTNQYINIDVIGHVIRDQEIVTRRVEGVETQMMNIIVENMEGHTIQLTLWGEHCVRLQKVLADRLNTKDVVPLVVILQMGKVKVFGNQAPTVQTVKNQSRFLTDLEIPEIIKYLDKLMKRPKAELSASTIVKHMDSSSSAIFSDDLQSGTVPIVNISDVPELPDQQDLALNWGNPNCTECESKGEFCSFRNDNVTESSGRLELQCVQPKPAQGGSNTVLIAGSIIGAFFFVVVVIALYWFFIMRKKDERKMEKFVEDYRDMKPTRYTFADIKKITNKFKEKLGEGAYGTVYKGKLLSEILVAVKLLSGATGNEEDFIKEVKTLCTIHHVNVVRLIGFCADGNNRALVYEFLPNDSLEKFIFSENQKRSSLGWDKIQDIAIGTAKGIECLHQGCDRRILHLDIKPHNILLDQNFVPKIADFGLAKLCSSDQSIVSMTAASGTMGYVAPEIFSRNFGNVSLKSDVYSFGMVLLEIVGARKNIDVTVQNPSQAHFPEWIYNRLVSQEEGKKIWLEENEEDEVIPKKLTVVGLWCIQLKPTDRPSMKNVVRMLEGNGEGIGMPPNPFASTIQNKSSIKTAAGAFDIDLTVLSR